MNVENLIKLVVVYVNSKPQGMWKMKSFVNYNGRKWWDSVKFVEVPFEYYNEGRVTISNVERYVDMYEDNPKYYKFL